MYLATKEIKQDPERRWAQRDRAFFGRGACGILAGAYLKMFRSEDVWAEKIVPDGRFGGNHIFVTDGHLAFDYRGYCLRQSLLANHANGWRQLRGSEWDYTTQRVDFDLLSTVEMNANKMLGPDQYLDDPVQRAEAFIKAQRLRSGCNA